MIKDLRYSRLTNCGLSAINPADANAPFLLVDGTINPNSDYIRRDLDFSDKANYDSIVEGAFGLAINFANVSDNGVSPSVYVDFLKNQITLPDTNVVTNRIGVFDNDFTFGLNPENWLKIAYERNGTISSDLHVGDRFIGWSVDNSGFADSFGWFQEGYSAVGYGFADYVEAYDGVLELFGSNNITLSPTNKTVTAKDFEISDTTKGVVLTSPDSSKWRITVDNTGTLITTSI